MFCLLFYYTLSLALLLCYATDHNKSLSEFVNLPLKERSKKEIKKTHKNGGVLTFYSGKFDE